MAFTVAHQMNSQTLWAPVEPGETVYTGSIIAVDTGTPLSGVRPMPVAAGAANVTNLDVPWGVVVGNNNVSGNLVFNTTYKTEYITAVSEGSVYGNTTNFTGIEGPYPKGDRYAMVEYIPITQETVLRGPLFNAAVGTALTEAVVSTGSGGDGLDCTSSAVQCTPVAQFATIYMRTGTARGNYRILTTTSTTVHEFTPDLVSDIGVNDIIVVGNVRPFGMSRAYIDTEGMYIDASAALTTNYLMIDVLRLDLTESGNEYVEFRFSSVNFQHTVRLDTDTT